MENIYYRMGNGGECMDFIVNNLEIIVAVVGGLSIGGILFTHKTKGGENDLTRFYIKYKRHSDSISKSSKTIF